MKAGYTILKSGRYGTPDYRGTLSDGGKIIWVCEHVHLFGQSKYLNKGQLSALSCAEAELRRREE